MPKLKRLSENQLNKDAYDADPDDRFAEQPDPGQGMTRASNDVMQRRKIVKVSRRKFGAGSGSGAPSAPTVPASQPPASSNPFASTTLAQPKAMTSQASKKGGDEPPAKANPFASIAFASNSASATTSAPKPTFSFGASAKSAPNPTISTSSFPSNAATSSLVNSHPSALTTPRSSLGKNENIQQLNQNLLDTIVDHWEGRMHAQDYTPFLEDYQRHEEGLHLEAGKGSDENKAPAGNSTVNLTSTAKGNSQPTSSFSFGGAAPASSPAAKPFSMGASAPAATAAGTFSFTSKPSAAPAAGASSAPKFSFGAPSSSSLASSATSAPVSNSNNDDPTSNPDDGKIDQVEQEENSEEEILHEVRAKRLTFENNEWKKYGTGVLRLYRHKVSSKHRMVIRNEIGKVQFNVGVSKGMKFEKVVKSSKKGQVAFIKFLAVEDASKGMEPFMLQVKPECVDKLHDSLNGIVL
mmetsp:Transcript_3057/g.6713  ORF Transcript_3057/g.6713 Transcript_3057/m.6713 type:complete len:466 (+) Transcript_3057:177-1574(+)|eukprot:CAMPEP_0172312364 /NCGR_PEP_ID=MMETSP1058-20130122/17238_1 /TAXON_ID=83371 /ORGANISM="Detonula confervacea, Strain CCMP 353" /LENGTH=465 /DNA_ID=CAMNT_0013025797 /DNA_START=139 /DNA_END=1536 /DNA_ORIENTATION=-